MLLWNGYYYCCCHNCKTTHSYPGIISSLSKHLNTSMTTATVFFNGPSVQRFYHIRPQPMEIGCNFILDHRPVHHVCAYDQPTINSIGADTLPGVRYWTRRTYAAGAWRTFQSTITHKRHHHVMGYCSGTMAMVLALQLGATAITLLGCDWTITNNSIYDNKYTWRAFPPTKHNKEKFKLFAMLSELVPVTVVHDTPREILGEHVIWKSSKDYLGEHE